MMGQYPSKQLETTTHPNYMSLMRRGFTRLPITLVPKNLYSINAFIK